MIMKTQLDNDGKEVETVTVKGSPGEEIKEKQIEVEETLEDNKSETEEETKRNKIEADEDNNSSTYSNNSELSDIKKLNITAIKMINEVIALKTTVFELETQYNESEESNDMLREELDKVQAKYDESRKQIKAKDAKLQEYEAIFFNFFRRRP